MLNIGEFARLGQVSPRMLRHYDEAGLLKPKNVDPANGYRSYEFGQLGRLHRLMALRDLGFTLDQIRSTLDQDPSVEQLRGMLSLRRAQIEVEIASEQGRLRRVEAHLRSLEGSIAMSSLDVAVKMSQSTQIAESSGLSAGFGHENLNPVFRELVPKVLDHLSHMHVHPWSMVAWYEEPSDDGSVVLHVGFEIGEQSVVESDGVCVGALPSVKVASVIHRGALDNVVPVYEALVGWIEDSGYMISGRSRELYHEWDDANPELSITELQMPIVAQ